MKISVFPVPGCTIPLSSAPLSMVRQAIQVADISKAGLGFSCTLPLEIGAVYEAYLTIWTKEVIHAFVEIIRIEKLEDTFKYGGIFIGMPEMDAARIIAMSFAVASLLADGTTSIEGGECVNISYPGFYKDLAALSVL